MGQTMGGVSLTFLQGGTPHSPQTEVSYWLPKSELAGIAYMIYPRMTWVIKHFLTGMHRRSHANRIRCSTLNADREIAQKCHKHVDLLTNAGCFWAQQGICHTSNTGLGYTHGHHGFEMFWSTQDWSEPLAQPQTQFSGMNACTANTAGIGWWSLVDLIIT